MKRRIPAQFQGWKNCPKCGELVRDVDNCEPCANRNPLSASRARHTNGQKGAPTLDIQEKNDGAWGDR